MPPSDAPDAKPSPGAGAAAELLIPSTTPQAPGGTAGTGDIEEPEPCPDSTPPPLPPRPPLPTSHAASLRLSRQSSRPQLLSTPTTALSSTHVHIHPRGGDESAQSSPAGNTVSRQHSRTHVARLPGNASDGDDSASSRSCIPSLDARADDESVLGDVAGGDTNPAWTALSAQVERDDPFETLSPEDDALSEQVQHEFDELERDPSTGITDDDLATIWKSKLKHFFILSASGKPIYSRHGDDRLISHYVGVAQTLMSFYQDAEDPLKGFTAGGTRFVMLSKGPVNLVATSRLPESDAQLRSQLEALYMQILSTLTRPSMEKMFKQRASTDLRRPLQGTDALLDGLADGFTRGSPAALLSALECLRLRKSHRGVVNNTLLKVRSPNLLYGLIVAAGRLVSVVRPKKHSLHPGDLHLIFNMLFEAGSVRAGGGENWIPICLPGFNNTGFLYMYVSFFSTAEGESKDSPEAPPQDGSSRDHELAIVLISAHKEAFDEMRNMRDDLVSRLESNGSMSVIKTAIRRGHAPTSSIVPGTALRHFLYKSRGNVQFVRPSFDPHFGGMVNRRRLMSLYHQMHEAIHSRTAHLKVQHSIATDSTSLAWETPLFELYCVAGPNASRDALVQGANKVVQWIRREEERVFIIGGAVF